MGLLDLISLGHRVYHESPRVPSGIASVHYGLPMTEREEVTEKILFYLTRLPLDQLKFLALFLPHLVRLMREHIKSDLYLLIGRKNDSGQQLLPRVQVREHEGPIKTYSTLL